MGLFSQISKNFGGKHLKVLKNGHIFWEKSLKICIFSAKMTLKNGVGFEAGAVHPIQAKSEYPPG